MRAFTDSARQDLRSELAPAFEDFEFEDLHPKTFVRKHMPDGGGLAAVDEIRNAFDPRPEREEVAAAVRDTGDGPARGSVPGQGGASEPAHAPRVRPRRHLTAARGPATRGGGSAESRAVV
ncbi:hypothetical protein ACFYZ9_37275 [Streptomyces sp. NPDC001691]|uniref:hypothetical protein n=1 Tax=Streptomyces sp. NPDC001691 TaxID=3364600 RepID=UPI003692C7C2